MLDLDECELGFHDCHPQATCKNTFGSYECHCQDGFKGLLNNYVNGRQCIGNSTTPTMLHSDWLRPSASFSNYMILHSLIDVLHYLIKYMH